MHIKFMVLIFITVAMLAVTTFGQRRFGDSNCECSGRPLWTRRCCEEHGGFFEFGRCHRGFSGRFLQCCERQGLRGACVA